MQINIIQIDLEHHCGIEGEQGYIHVEGHWNPATKEFELHNDLGCSECGARDEELEDEWVRYFDGMAATFADYPDPKCG